MDFISQMYSQHNIKTTKTPTHFQMDHGSKNCQAADDDDYEDVTEDENEEDEDDANCDPSGDSNTGGREIFDNKKQENKPKPHPSQTFDKGNEDEDDIDPTTEDVEENEMTFYLNDFSQQNFLEKYIGKWTQNSQIFQEMKAQSNKNFIPRLKINTMKKIYDSVALNKDSQKIYDHLESLLEKSYSIYNAFVDARTFVKHKNIFQGLLPHYNLIVLSLVNSFPNPSKFKFGFVCQRYDDISKPWMFKFCLYESTLKRKQEFEEFIQEMKAKIEISFQEPGCVPLTKNLAALSAGDPNILENGRKGMEQKLGCCMALQFDHNLCLMKFNPSEKDCQNVAKISYCHFFPTECDFYLVGAGRLMDQMKNKLLQKFQQEIAEKTLFFEFQKENFPDVRILVRGMMHDLQKVNSYISGQFHSELIEPTQNKKNFVRSNKRTIIDMFSQNNTAIECLPGGKIVIWCVDDSPISLKIIAQSVCDYITKADFLEKKLQFHPRLNKFCQEKFGAHFKSMGITFDAKKQTLHGKRSFVDECAAKVNQAMEKYLPFKQKYPCSNRRFLGLFQKKICNLQKNKEIEFGKVKLIGSTNFTNEDNSQFSVTLVLFKDESESKIRHADIDTLFSLANQMNKRLDLKNWKPSKQEIKEMNTEVTEVVPLFEKNLKGFQEKKDAIFSLMINSISKNEFEATIGQIAEKDEGSESCDIQVSHIVLQILLNEKRHELEKIEKSMGVQFSQFKFLKLSDKKLLFDCKSGNVKEVRAALEKIIEETTKNDISEAEFDIKHPSLLGHYIKKDFTAQYPLLEIKKLPGSSKIEEMVFERCSNVKYQTRQLEIKVLMGDVAYVIADGIVVPSNENFTHTYGLAKAVDTILVPKSAKYSNEIKGYLSGQKKLPQKESLLIELENDCPLKTKKLIMTNISEGGHLEEGIKNILSKAEEGKIASVAVPAIGCGVKKFPINETVTKIIQTVLDIFQSQQFDEVKNVFFFGNDRNIVELFAKSLKMIKEKSQGSQIVFDSLNETDLPLPEKIDGEFITLEDTADNLLQGYTVQWLENGNIWKNYPAKTNILILSKIHDEGLKKFSLSSIQSQTHAAGAEYVFDHDKLSQQNISSPQKGERKVQLIEHLHYYFTHAMKQRYFSNEEQFLINCTKHEGQKSKIELPIDNNKTMIIINLSKDGNDDSIAFSDDPQKKIPLEKMKPKQGSLIYTQKNLDALKKKKEEHSKTLQKEKKEKEIAESSKIIISGSKLQLKEFESFFKKRDTMISQHKIELEEFDSKKIEELKDLADELGLCCVENGFLNFVGKENKIKRVPRRVDEKKELWNGSTVQYPPEWGVVKGKENSHKAQLVLLDQKSDEFKQCFQIFSKTMPNSTVVRIERIHNCVLWRNYWATRYKVLKNFNNDQPNERLLFHGTSSHDPKEIALKDSVGLDYRYSNIACLWGVASYFAEDASYSDASYSFKNTDGSKSLLLCKVAIGASISLPSDKSLKKPPQRIIPGVDYTVYYDTVEGVSNSVKIFMKYETNHSYPNYLITYN